MASAALVTTVLMVMLAADDPSARFSKQFNDGGSFGQTEGAPGTRALIPRTNGRQLNLATVGVKRTLIKWKTTPASSLENHDPNSFWYTMRPNLFNIR